MRGTLTGLGGFKRALTLLLAHWPAVQALAQALVEDRRIEGERVERIIGRSIRHLSPDGGRDILRIIVALFALAASNAGLAEPLRQTFRDANGREVGRAVSDAMGRNTGRSVTSGNTTTTVYDFLRSSDRTHQKRAMKWRAISRDWALSADHSGVARHVVDGSLGIASSTLNET